MNEAEYAIEQVGTLQKKIDFLESYVEALSAYLKHIQETHRMDMNCEECESRAYDIAVDFIGG